MTTVAEYLWQTIRGCDVSTVYGLPGTTTLGALEALRRHGGLRFVSTRHEQAAAHMADASARMLLPFGVALVDLGPGLANTTIAMLAAMRDSSPLLVVAGNEERRLVGREVWHEMPELQTFASITKSAARVESVDALPRLLRSALQAATTGRPGPALLSIPKDLWNAELPTPGGGAGKWTAMPSRMAPDPSALEQVAHELRCARRPVLVIGGGARRSRCGDELLRLVEQTGLPVVSSPNGRGVLSERHPLCLGVSGRFGNSQASEALHQADLVIALGCSLNDLTTNEWALLDGHPVVVQVDADAERLNANWPADVPVQADARAFIESLSPVAERMPAWWRLEGLASERIQARDRFLSIADATLVKPQAVMRSLERRLTGSHTVVMGGGRYQQFVGEFLVDSPTNFFYAANSGCMGFALPAAIGVAIEHPARQVVCALGDGDFMMCVQELETAVRERANIKCIVLNDFAYGAMKARQKVPFGTDLGNPPFDELARCFGGTGRRVDRGTDVDAAVSWLLDQSGLAVLDVLIDAGETRSLLYGHDIGGATARASGDSGERSTPDD